MSARDISLVMERLIRSTLPFLISTGEIVYTINKATSLSSTQNMRSEKEIYNVHELATFSGLRFLGW